MKTGSIAEIKKELHYKTKDELLNLCLQLARFKKENKELLTYLLFEFDDEENYRVNIKKWMENEFQNINTKNFFYIKKSARKILTQTKKFIRYSKNLETQADVLLHFCTCLKSVQPSINDSLRLQNIFDSQLSIVEKTIQKLHPDLQFDYIQEIASLKNG